MFRFLLVDDNADDAMALMFLIEQEYAQIVRCEAASSLAAALEWLNPEKHERFDAILLDLNLTDSVGPATFHAVREAAPGTPIVIWSGRHDDRDVVDKLIDAGADSYLRKGAANVEQVFETLRDAAKRAAISVRFSGREIQNLKKSEKAANALLREASRSDPPGAAKRLNAEAIAAQQAILRDMMVQLATNSEQLERLSKDHDKTADVTDTLRTKAQSAEQAQARLEAELAHIDQEQGRLRDLSLRNKRKLAGLGLAISAVGYALGEGREQIVDLIHAIFGG
jgi:DNA-binding NarL/FixJ family response regulator